MEQSDKQEVPDATLVSCHSHKGLWVRLISDEISRDYAQSEMRKGWGARETSRHSGGMDCSVLSLGVFISTQSPLHFFSAKVSVLLSL